MPVRFEFRPYHELEQIPNVICDGSPAGDGTRITLSHWPGTKLDEKFKADSSTQIAFKWAESGAAEELFRDVWDGIVACSNNHVDEDGLLSMSVLVHQEWAFAHRMVVEAASIVGDFSKCDFSRPEGKEAFRLVWAIRFMLDPATSPFPKTVFDKSDYMKATAEQYAAMLPLVPKLHENLDTEKLWQNAEEELKAMREQIVAGNVLFERMPELDLAFVRIKPAAASAVSTGSPSYPEAHNFPYLPSTIAIYSDLAYGHLGGSNVDCFRVTIEDSGKWDLRYRYESRIQYQSKPGPLPRKDWSSLRDRLAKLETESSVRWIADGYDGVVPGIRNEGGASAIPYEVIRSEIVGFFESFGRRL